MNDKTASTKMTGAEASSSHKSSSEFSQSLDIQVTEATYVNNHLSEISVANRSKAARNLRAIAHLLLSGSLGLLMVFSCAFRQQNNESYLTLPEQGAAQVLR